MQCTDDVPEGDSDVSLNLNWESSRYCDNLQVPVLQCIAKEN